MIWFDLHLNHCGYYANLGKKKECVMIQDSDSGNGEE